MRSSKAPRFHYVSVDVHVDLANSRTWDAGWNTHMGFNQALHKARKWIVEDMQKHKVVGRSKIVGIAITTRLVKGGY